MNKKFTMMHINEVRELYRFFDKTFRYGMGGLESRTGVEYVDCLNFLTQQNKLNGFIEIGSAWGGSFDLWSQLISNGPKISVDRPGYVHAQTIEICYRRNKIWESRFSDVYSILGDSTDPKSVEAVKQILGNSLVSWLYIDGNHDYDYVKSDFEKYEKFVRPGGFIGFHDYVHFTPGSVKVVKEIMKKWPNTKLWEFKYDKNNKPLDDLIPLTQHINEQKGLAIVQLVK